VRLARSGSGYLLEDLGSVNLTYVNDQRLEPNRSIPLRDGDHILMGSLRLIFRQV
jgi:pSer/pThr/pTyr-binding forkhead associated (FHA) protein